MGMFGGSDLNRTRLNWLASGYVLCGVLHFGPKFLLPWPWLSHG